jgi:hypothetical protein
MGSVPSSTSSETSLRHRIPSGEIPLPGAGSPTEVAWTETSSLSFTARHEAGQGDAALSVLESLEEYRVRLEQLFPRVPGNVTVVLHDSALQLALAQPYLSIARRLASPAGRRYMAGWFGRDEVHVLAPAVLRKRAGGAGSLEALMLTPQRVYTLLVVGESNPLLPPPFRPSSLGRLPRLAWLLEGAGQYFSGQLPHLGPAISRRLREGRIAFPPGPRDAPLLAGPLFDLLARERGVDACVELALSDDLADPKTALGSAFGLGAADLAHRWRSHLQRLAQDRNIEAASPPPKVS